MDLERRGGGGCIEALDELDAVSQELRMLSLLIWDAPTMAEDPEMCNAYSTSIDDILGAAIGRVRKAAEIIGGGAG